MQIEIRTNMNKNSVLALEFINVANANIQRPECMRDEPPPTTTTQPTTTSSTTASTTTPQPESEETDATTSKPPGESAFNDAHTNDDSQSISVVWIILIICFAFIIIIIILVVVFIYLIRPRFTTKVLHVTRPIDDDDDNGGRTAPHVQTIPRLHVLHDPVNGPYVSGVNYIKHLEEDEMGWSRHHK